MNITLHYREKGNKEPFILLHGNGEDNSYFKHQIDYFSNRYRVIALDTRGHGKSPRGTKSFTIEQIRDTLHSTKRLKAFCKQYNNFQFIRKNNIFGLSLIGQTDNYEPE